MTERLADVTARIQGIHQLGAVVNAMRGIAAARVQQARSELLAVDSYAAAVAGAIGRVLTQYPAAPEHETAGASRDALILFCAEQGFAGAFSQRVLDAVPADLAGSEIFLVGTRGAAAAAERGLSPHWTSAMPSHSPGVPKLADIISEALFDPIAKGQIRRLDAVFTEWRPAHGPAVVRRRLFPYDLTQFQPSPHREPPLLNLQPDALLGDLAADYLHARLCEAALHAFAAENQARMESMAAARSQIERQLAALQATERQVRQTTITAEIIELAAGETASQTDEERTRGSTGGWGAG